MECGFNCVGDFVQILVAFVYGPPYTWTGNQVAVNLSLRYKFS